MEIPGAGESDLGGRDKRLAGLDFGGNRVGNPHSRAAKAPRRQGPAPPRPRAAKAPPPYDFRGNFRNSRMSPESRHIPDFGTCAPKRVAVIRIPGAGRSDLEGGTGGGPDLISGANSGRFSDFWVEARPPGSLRPPIRFLGNSRSSRNSRVSTNFGEYTFSELTPRNGRLTRLWPRAVEDDRPLGRPWARRPWLQSQNEPALPGPGPPPLSPEPK